MSNEKSIKPANGYVMFALVLAVFIGGIAMAIRYENPAWIFATVVAFICAFGFILVNPNSSKVILLFGKYIGTVKTNGLYWANPLYKKEPFL